MDWAHLVWAVVTTLQSKLRGMGRLAGLTFASSLCFEEIGFVLGHKNQKKRLKGEKGRDKWEEEGEGKKEGEREGGREKEIIFFSSAYEIP